MQKVARRVQTGYPTSLKNDDCIWREKPTPYCSVDYARQRKKSAEVCYQTSAVARSERMKVHKETKQMCYARSLCENGGRRSLCWDPKEGRKRRFAAPKGPRILCSTLRHATLLLSGSAPYHLHRSSHQQHLVALQFAPYCTFGSRAQGC